MRRDTIWLTSDRWNAALVLATRAIAAAIGAGCTVVLKASELSPLTHHTIVEIFEQAGCPKGVLNQVQVAREDAAEITELLIANERIRKIEFIGSAAVGRIIGSVAAKHLKPVLMELGGKCPAIVLDDADLHKAATLCMKGGKCRLHDWDVMNSLWYFTDQWHITSIPTSRSDMFLNGAHHRTQSGRRRVQNHLS